MSKRDEYIAGRHDFRVYFGCGLLFGAVVSTWLSVQLFESAALIVATTAFGALTIIKRVEEHGVPVREIINTGVIRSVNPQAVVRDNVTSYVANVDFTGDTAGKLRPDMTANVTIATGQRSRAVVVPERSVVRDAAGQAYVFVQNGRNVEKRRVRLGDAAAGGLVVREGLAGGESLEAEPNPPSQ